MNFFKRAMVSVTRRIGKTTILLALVFILGNVIAGSISIGQSVENTKNAVRKGIKPIATVGVNYQKVEKEIEKNLGFAISDIDWSDPEMGERYSAESRKYNFTADKIEALGSLKTVAAYDYSTQLWQLETGGSGEIKIYYSPELQELGYKTYDGMSEQLPIKGFQNNLINEKLGIIKMIDGTSQLSKEENTDLNEIVISKGFAEENNLQVGSTFTLGSPIYDFSSGKDAVMESGVSIDENGEATSYGPEIAKTLPFDFIVSGIYEYVKDPNKNLKQENAWEIKEQLNQLYCTNKTINAIQKIYNDEMYKNDEETLKMINEDDTNYTPVFSFNSIEDFETFKKDVKKINPLYTVTNNQADFSKATAPLANMSKMANLILFVGIGASLVILSLLITLFLKDRKNEIGIYLALGERKSKVVSQVLSEVLVVSILGIALSLFSGNIISSAVSHSMMDSQVTAEQEKAAKEKKEEEEEGIMKGGMISINNLSYMGYDTEEITLEQLADSYEVKLGANIAFMFLGIGTLTVLLSTLIPIMYVLRLNPRKILM